jgi:hypothetical protein
MAGIGAMVAKKLPPPDKLKGYGRPSDEETPAEDAGEGAPDEAAEDEAAGTSMMQDVLDAVKSGDAAEACRSLDAYLESRGFVKK